MWQPGKSLKNALHFKISYRAKAGNSPETFLQEIQVSPSLITLFRRVNVSPSRQDQLCSPKQRRLLPFQHGHGYPFLCYKSKWFAWSFDERDQYWGLSLWFPRMPFILLLEDAPSLGIICTILCRIIFQTIKTIKSYQINNFSK